MTQSTQVTEEIVFIKRSVAASLAGVSGKTISQWCQDGKIKYQKDASGRYLIDKSSLDLVEPDELEDTGTTESRLFAHVALLLGQAHTHIERKEKTLELLSRHIADINTSRVSHTIEALGRLTTENAAQHRENEKLRRELLKLETAAASEAFDTDSHLRTEDRKDKFANAVVGVIEDKMGVSDSTKKVVETVLEMGKDPESKE